MTHALPWWRTPVSLLALAGPIIASMISRTVMSFVDFVMVSTLGTEAQAAIMPAGILLFCVISFGMGLLSVVNTFVAQASGRNQPEQCASYAWQGIYLALAMGLVVLPAWPVVDELFAAVGHAPAVQAMEVSYVRIGLLSLAPMLVGVAVADFFNGIQRPMVGFWAMIISNALNALANWVLIFGHLGFPAMGITGAAIGTVIACVVQAALLLTWMLRPAMHARFSTRSHTKPSWLRIKRMIRIGIPAGGQFTIDIAAFTVFTLVLVGQFSTEQLAAHNLVFKYLEVAFMPTIGLGVAVTSAVGHAIGRQDPAQARRVVRWATAIAMTYMGTIAMGYVIFRSGIATLLSDDPEVIEWAVRLLLLAAVFQVFDALGIAHVNALRGAGDNVFGVVASLMLALTVFLTGGWAMTHWKPEWGVVGPWLAATVYVVLLGVAYWARWRFGPWERIELENG